MTEHDLIRQRVRAVISAEADDIDVEQLRAQTRLRRHLNLSGPDRIALCFALQVEFGQTFDDAAWNAITDPFATVSGVELAVVRNVTTKATT